ncbi:MAG: protoporphyrinogen oxidase [Bacteroidetes bacterium]|nr:MAG: protoporphyrinogen oxidase [Bacteroidota bacterium]MBL1145070.1 protoporphyrinogen oxidase [Bacteroidota bacterium]NOG57867.1 protoporphyrinogen oxidase [Bacteroidota bacterium]
MIAILGGGISGLSIAYTLKKAGKKFILLEADNEVGGKIKSRKQKGYTFELGPNTVLINNPEIKSLLDELNLNQEIIQPDELAVKKRFILCNGKMEALPSSPGSLFSSKLIGLRSIFKVLGEPFKKPLDGKLEESLADFTRRRLGNEIYENFVYPFVTGIYAGDPEKMTMDYTLKILKEAEQNHGSIIKGMIKTIKAKKAENEASNIPKQKIFIFKDGLQRLPLRMAEEMSSEISYNSKVLQIIKLGQGYQINYTKEGEECSVKVEKLISTLPVHHLTNLITWNSDLTNALNQIHYVPAIICHFGYQKNDITTPEKAFGILSRKVETAPFLGVLFNSKFFPHTAPADKELITVISGGYKQEDFANWTVSKIQTTVKQAINDLFQSKNEPEFEHFYQWNQGIPQYEMGHKKIVAAIEKFELEHNGFHILGNFRDGISVSDCIANGIKFANSFNL